MYSKIILSLMAVIALFLIQAEEGFSAQKIKGKVTIVSDNATQCKNSDDQIFQKVCNLTLKSEGEKYIIFVDGKANKKINFEKGQAVILKSKSFGKEKAKIAEILTADGDLKGELFKDMKNIILWHVYDDCYLVLETSKKIEVPAGDTIKMKLKVKKVQKVEGC